jgi:anti-sigma28 factor (negative regulator of flagellin synthesis)
MQGSLRPENYFKDSSRVKRLRKADIDLGVLRIDEKRLSEALLNYKSMGSKAVRRQKRT